MNFKCIKSVLAAALAISVLLSASGNAFAEKIKIYYGNDIMTFDKEPVIYNNRTMVPAEEFLGSAKMDYSKEETGALTVGNIVVAEGETISDSEISPMNIDNTLFMPIRSVMEALNKKVLWNNEERAVTVLNNEELITAIPQKVKDGRKAAIVFIHDDGGKATGNWLVKTLPKYNVNASVAIIGKSIDPEYNVNEPDNFEKWQVILAKSNGRLNFAVHSHGHRYMGESDEAESGVLSNGSEYSYEAGHLTKDIAGERARINEMFPDERLLAFVKPGTLYPEGKKQVSDAAMAMIKEHYIAMRNTGGEVDTLPPEDVYSVKSLMGTSTDDYSDIEKNHTAKKWIAAMDEAIEKNGMLVYLFHNIADETEAKGNNTARSRVEMLLSAICDRIDSGDVWNGKFDEVMQYTQEFNAITSVKAVNYPSENRIEVEVSDSISKIDTDLVGTKFEGQDMFDYPITVKVELPYDWEYAKLTQSYNNRTEIVKAFSENGTRYIYANVVPDQAAASICEAAPNEYISEITVDGAAISGFEPTKFYYKVIRKEGDNAPAVSVANSDAEIMQADLDENGEGSAFIKLGSLCYEVYFCNEVKGKDVLLRIDTSKDDENLTVTKKVIEYLAKKGIAANITDAAAFEKLKDYENAVYCEVTDANNCAFDFDDEYTEDVEGDYMLSYNQFVLGYREAADSNLIMTMHPESKSDLLLSIFEDQINFLIMQKVNFIK